MGQAAPGFDIAIIDEDGRELPPGKVGQIAVRVKPVRPLAMFQEYWRNPQETAARYLGDFYLTGDTAYRDAEGYFYFGGRADDVINSSSYRIGPSEVESALLEHPAVLEAGAIGVPLDFPPSWSDAFAGHPRRAGRSDGLHRLPPLRVCLQESSRHCPGGADFL